MAIGTSIASTALNTRNTFAANRTPSARAIRLARGGTDADFCAKRSQSMRNARPTMPRSVDAVSTSAPARKVTLMSTSAQANENAPSRAGPIWWIEARGGECWLDVIGECRRRSAKTGRFCNPPYLAPSAQSRSIAGTGKLMSSRLHEVAKDICLAELLAGLETVQALHQDVTLAVLAHQDRHLQAILQYAFSDLLRLPGIEHGAPFRRYVDVRNSECLALHHGRGSLPIQSAFRYSKFQHGHAAAAVAAALDGSRLIRCGAKTISASIAAPASHIRRETP